MKKGLFIFSAVIIVVALLSSSRLMAQNITPYWSISGNSNAGINSKLGTTNSVPLRFFTKNVERIRIDASGNVGIGTSLPVNILTIKLGGSTPAASWLNGGGSPAFMAFAENMTTGFNLATAADPAGYRPVLNTRRSRGTLALPAAVHNNDYLASFVASGYDGSNFQNPATIDFYVDGTPSPGNVPGRISFVTGSNKDNRLERLKVGSTGNFNFNNTQLTIIQATGNVGIGTNSPSSRLHVTGSGRFTKGVLVDSGGVVAAAGNTFGTGVSGKGYYGVSGTGTYGVSGSGDVGLYGVGGPTGVIGFGNKYGVFGDGKEYGMYGNSDKGFGVFGVSNLANGTGIRGEATGASATGIYGLGGVFGVVGFCSQSGGAGVRGEAHTVNSSGVLGSGELYGVYGYTSSDAGVSLRGQAIGANSTGVYGNGGVVGVKGICNFKDGNGVYGSSLGANSFGVVGKSLTNVGVYGEGRLGVTGYSSVNGGRGVDGEVSEPNAIGVYGYNAVPSDLQHIYYAGYFDGDVGTTGGYWTVSDRKLKQSIDEIPNAMDILKKLHPKSYNFRQDGNYKLMNLPAGNQYGLIAQEVEQVLPNLVKDTRFDSHRTLPPKNQGENEVSAHSFDTVSSEIIPYKTINYTPLIPIVIKGMQEQQVEIDELEKKSAEVDALKQQVAELRQMVLDLKNATTGTVILSGSYLEQNNPNPVSGLTTIRYYVPGKQVQLSSPLVMQQGNWLKQ